MKTPSIKYTKIRAWGAFSKYIRTRDPKCVTCGFPTTEAGHYRHNSDKPNKQLGGNELWYNDHNVNGQCMRCNRYLSGNLEKYALFLEKKYGMGELQVINYLYNCPKKWTIEELLEVEQLYIKKLKDLNEKIEKGEPIC